MPSRVDAYLLTRKVNANTLGIALKRFYFEFIVENCKLSSILTCHVCEIISRMLCMIANRLKMKKKKTTAAYKILVAFLMHIFHLLSRLRSREQMLIATKIQRVENYLTPVIPVKYDTRRNAPETVRPNDIFKYVIDF